MRPLSFLAYGVRIFALFISSSVRLSSVSFSASLAVVFVNIIIAPAIIGDPDVMATHPPCVFSLFLFG